MEMKAPPRFNSAAVAKSLQSCLTLRDPLNCSPPGSSIHGTFQARVLEWGAIAFYFDSTGCVVKQKARLRFWFFKHRLHF